MKVFLATHGKMASGVKNTLDILLGNSDKLTAYDAYVDDSSIHEVIDDFLEKVEDEETVLFLSDIYGGSVNQVMTQKAVRSNTYLVAGVNLAFVLDIMLKDDVSAEIIDISIAESRNAMQRVELDSIDIEEEDFF